MKIPYVGLSGLAMLSLWTVPISRGVKFIVYTRHVYRETESINSYNDYSYARALLLTYMFGFVISAGMVWLLGRTKFAGFWIHTVLAGLGALFITTVKPERVITLIPPTVHWLFASGYLILGLSAITIVFLRSNISDAGFVETSRINHE